jgi:hypothetical protein
VKAITGPAGWLEAEWSDGQTHETERPARDQAVFMRDPKSLRAGVRASIVALKPGNAGGAKGRREVETR